MGRIEIQGECTFKRMRLTAVILVLLTACSDGGSRTSQASASDSPAANPIADSSTAMSAIRGSLSMDTVPSGVVRRYYAAIDSRRYEDAYAFWSDSGRASGKTANAFAAGFAQTATTRVTIGDSVHIEGAAGSQYATVPVVVDATLRSGEQQRFTGEYVLRRAIADGASVEQRKWRIYSARLYR